MSDKQSHRIKVLGRELTVKSPSPAEHVREVEGLVNRKLAEARAQVPVGDPQVPVILALMNLAETSLSLARELEEQRHASSDKLRRLMRRIEDALL